jgi:hypothetical protein
MDRTPTPGQSDPRSKVPMGVVTRSRADTPLPNVFRDLVEECPRKWEVRRIAQLTPARQDRQWRFIRASRSVFDRIPASPDMDVLFYRFPSERGYFRRLSQLRYHQRKRSKLACPSN